MAQNVTIAGASYADVPAIDVPKTGGGTARFVDPVGTLSITANGTHDVTNYAGANVNVPTVPKTKRFSLTLPSDIASFTHKVFVTDSEIAEHYADSTLFATLIFIDGFQNKTSIQLLAQGNLSRGGVYAAGLRSSSSAVAQFGATVPLNHIPSSSTSSSIFTKSNGDIGFTVSSSYPLRAGNYELIVTW